MQHKVQLSVGSQDKILSKEQKKFNDLLDKIKAMKENIVAMRTLNAQFHKTAAALIEASLENQVTLFVNTIEIVQTQEGLKQFVKEFDLPQETEMADINIFDFFAK
jgi:uncharacterized coiled-coil protein SlyX